MQKSSLAATTISGIPRVFPDLFEAWRYRALGLALARRNVRVRYRQTVLGSLWMVLQPLLFTGVITVVLGVFLEVPSGGLPYAVFALSGATIWSLFQRALNESATSLTSSGNIIQKVYFPRTLVPVASVAATIVDLVPIYTILILVVAAYGRFSGWAMLASPFFILLALLLALAAGLFATVLDAVFRDIRLIIPSLLQLLLYLSPIMYSESVVPSGWNVLYNLNPLVGIITGFRWSVIAGATPPDLFSVIWSCIFVLASLTLSLFTFARLENFAVDRI